MSFQRGASSEGMAVTDDVGGGASIVARVDEPARLLATGVRALAEDGNLQASREWSEAAFDGAERSGDLWAQAGAVLGLSGLWVHEHRTAAASMVLASRLRQLLGLVDPQSILGLRLRVRWAAENDYSGGRTAAILAALQEARAAGDPVALVEALSLAHHCLLSPGQGPQRRALAADLIGQSSRTGRRGDLLVGLLWHSVDLFLYGDPPRSVAWVSSRSSWCRERTSRSGSWSARSRSCRRFEQAGSTRLRRGQPAMPDGIQAEHDEQGGLFPHRRRQGERGRHELRQADRRASQPHGIGERATPGAHGEAGCPGDTQPQPYRPSAPTSTPPLSSSWAESRGLVVDAFDAASAGQWWLPTGPRRSPRPDTASPSRSATPTGNRYHATPWLQRPSSTRAYSPRGRPCRHLV